MISLHPDDCDVSNWELRSVVDCLQQLFPDGQLQDAEIDELSQPARIRQAALFLMGAAAGLGLGVLLAALLEYRDKTLKSEEDVLTALALPVLALVPQMLSRHDRRVRRRRRLLFSTAGAVLAVVAVAGAVWKVGPW